MMTWKNDPRGLGETPAPPFLREIALAYLKIALSSFGGGLSAWARQIIVEEKRWLSDEAFLSALTFSRILPGANQVNLAVFVGTTLRGAPGALAALTGLLALPLAIAVAFGVAYLSFSQNHLVSLVLSALTATSIGMTLATGFSISRRLPWHPATLLVAGASFVAVGPMKWPLLPVLVVLIPLSVALHWRPAERKAP